MALEAFNSYHSYLNAIEQLNDAERGRLWTALLEYSSTGTISELRGNERFVFPQMKWQIDRDKETYDALCKERSKAGKRGAASRWQTDNSDGKDSKSHFCNGKDSYNKDKDNDKDNLNLQKQRESTSNSARNSAPPCPSVFEVADYCTSRKSSVDPQAFVDYYESRDWTQKSGEPVRDWKALVRVWESRDKHRPAKEPQPDSADANKTPWNGVDDL